MRHAKPRQHVLYERGTAGSGEQALPALRLALLTEDFDNMKMGISCPLSPLHQMALSNRLSNSLAASCYASPRTSRETSPTALRATGS